MDIFRQKQREVIERGSLPQEETFWSAAHHRREV